MSSEDSEMEMDDRAPLDSGDEGSLLSSGEEEEMEADLQALLEARARSAARTPLPTLTPLKFPRCQCV